MIILTVFGIVILAVVGSIVVGIYIGIVANIYKRCPHCAKRIYKKVKVCPYCTRDYPELPK